MRGGGFTLLEVMISLGILAVALVALSDLNGGAVLMQAYARRATEATLLLRSKMSDLEEQLQKEGFSDFDDEKHGSFEDEGAPDYSWRAEILKPDPRIDASQLLGLFGLEGKGPSGAPAGLLGGGGPIGAGSPGGATAFAALGSAAGGALGGGMLAGVLQTQAKTFLETVKKSVREIRLTVTWKDGREERSVSASQQIVILPEEVGKAGQTPAPSPQQLPGTPGLPFPGPGGPLQRLPAGEGR